MESFWLWTSRGLLPKCCCSFGTPVGVGTGDGGSVWTLPPSHSNNARGPTVFGRPPLYIPSRGWRFGGESSSKNPAKGSQQSLSLILMITEKVSTRRSMSRFRQDYVRSKDGPVPANVFVSRGADRPCGAYPFAVGPHCVGPLLIADPLRAFPLRHPPSRIGGSRSGDPDRLAFRGAARAYRWSAAPPLGLPRDRNRPSFYLRPDDIPKADLWLKDHLTYTPPLEACEGLGTGGVRHRAVRNAVRPLGAEVLWRSYR